MEKSTELIKRGYSALALAYLGDSFYETLAREHVIGDGNCSISEINRRIMDYVTAVSQSRIAALMLPYLNETEAEFFRYGRNTHNSHRSKSAQALEYRRATGLECLFGYLYLSGMLDRARELFSVAAAGEHKQEEIDD